MIIDVVIASTSRFEKYGPVCAPEDAEDGSGRVILDEIEAGGHRAGYSLLPDGIEPIRDAVMKSQADAVIICGGTGLTTRDLTLEAVEPLYQKTIPGFGEFFRQRSLEEVGTRAMLSRASAGVFQGRPVFCIPGSPNAARLGVELVLAELTHIVKHISE